VWGSPWPGAIIYAFVPYNENYENVRERIHNGAYFNELAVGVESLVALGLAGAEVLGAAGAAAYEVAPATFASYEKLIEMFTLAVQGVGQSLGY
jgi:hypothetical protein